MLYLYVGKIQEVNNVDALLLLLLELVLFLLLLLLLLLLPHSNKRFRLSCGSDAEWIQKGGFCEFKSPEVWRSGMW